MLLEHIRRTPILLRNRAFPGCLFGRAKSGHAIMIKNGLYSLSTTALDAVDGGSVGVLVLLDGKLYGGDSFFYFIGTYSSSDGKWKGEMTSQEHTKAPTTRPMAGRIVNVGFSGTYTDEGAQAGVTALVGKRSIRYDAILRLLVEG